MGEPRMESLGGTHGCQLWKPGGWHLRHWPSRAGVGWKDQCCDYIVGATLWECLYLWSWRRKQETPSREVDCVDRCWLGPCLMPRRRPQSLSALANKSHPLFQFILSAWSLLKEDLWKGWCPSLKGLCPWQGRSSILMPFGMDSWVSCGQMMSTVSLGRALASISAFLELLNMRLPGYRLEVLLLILQFLAFISLRTVFPVSICRAISAYRWHSSCNYWTA